MTDNIYDFSSKKKKDGGGEPPSPPPVQEDLVEALEDLLEMAKKGTLIEMAGVAGLVSGQRIPIDAGYVQDPFGMFGTLQHFTLEYRDIYINFPAEFLDDE